MPVLTSLELEYRQTARYLRRCQSAKVFRLRPLIEQRVPHKRDQLLELARSQVDRRLEQGIQFGQNRR